MNDMFTDDDRTDAWLIDASRKLDEPTGDVERLINSITAGLGRVRRPTRTLATDDSAIAVSDRVIRQLLATRVRVATGRLVVSAIVEGDGDAVTGVTLGLIARYLDDLLADADRIRDVVGQVLIETVGERSSAAARSAVTVRWQDLYTREWLS